MSSVRVMRVTEGVAGFGGEGPLLDRGAGSQCGSFDSEDVGDRGGDEDGRDDDAEDIE